MSDNKQERKKAKGKDTAFELTEETQTKAAALLDDMLVRVRARIPSNPALALVKQNIEKIDELNKEGATLAQIFEHMNKGLKLGISASSFVQYVRRIRQETGSELYVSRKQHQSKNKAEAEAAHAERSTEVEWNQEQTTGAVAACPACGSSNFAAELMPGINKNLWRCDDCKHICEDVNGQPARK